MATYTRAELARDVLIGHRISGAEGDISAADEALVIRTYDNLHAEFEEEARAYWKSDEIPRALMEPLKEIVWNRLANAFGRAQPPEEQHQRETILMKRFHRLTARYRSGVPIKAEYY